MQADAIKPGQTVVVVDDLIATGESLSEPFLCYLYTFVYQGDLPRLLVSW